METLVQKSFSSVTDKPAEQSRTQQGHCSTPQPQACSSVHRRLSALSLFTQEEGYRVPAVLHEGHKLGGGHPAMQPYQLRSLGLLAVLVSYGM